MKRFTMVVTIENDVINIATENKGFNSLEILGLLENKKDDIIKQMQTPSKFERTLIDDGKKFVITEEETK